MNEHLISVIIPVYNTAEYLPRCLDSILNNTYKHLEILCFNDGSKDNSLEVLNGYAAKDPRVRVIDQENAGVSAARNRGLDEAEGEYIAFVDSDDWVHRQYFEVLLNTVREHEAHIAICGYVMTEDVYEDPVLSKDLIAARQFTHSQSAALDNPSWGRIYSRSSIGSIRFDADITLAEDTVFHLELLRTQPGLRMVRMEAPMYYYYTRQSSLVHTQSHAKFIPLINYCFNCIGRFGNQEVENACLIKACKTLFRWRYYIMFQRHSDERLALQKLLNQAYALLRSAEGLSTKTKVFYLTMARFPIVYRLLRIAKDPTMLGWEKLQREKARAEKNKK